LGDSSEGEEIVVVDAERGSDAQKEGMSKRHNRKRYREDGSRRRPRHRGAEGGSIPGRSSAHSQNHNSLSAMYGSQQYHPSRPGLQSPNASYQYMSNAPSRPYSPGNLSGPNFGYAGPYAPHPVSMQYPPQNAPMQYSPQTSGYGPPAGFLRAQHSAPHGTGPAMPPGYNPYVFGPDGSPSAGQHWGPHGWS
jgi:hypothetical protein